MEKDYWKRTWLIIAWGALFLLGLRLWILDIDTTLHWFAGFMVRLPLYTWLLWTGQILFSNDKHK